MSKIPLPIKNKKNEQKIEEIIEKSLRELTYVIAAETKKNGLDEDGLFVAIGAWLSQSVTILDAAAKSVHLSDILKETLKENNICITRFTIRSEQNIQRKKQAHDKTKNNKS